MSLYYDAAFLLTAPTNTGGSFKSRVYNTTSLKAAPAHIFALVAEASKWDLLLKEVIDNAGILSLEPKVKTDISSIVLPAHEC
jgi:putative methyltransferase